MAKLLFLVSSLQGGGAERIACVLCNAWSEQGHLVTLMPTFSGRAARAYSISDRVVVDHLVDHVNGSRSRIQRLVTLRKRIKQHDPDVIVSFLPMVNIAAILSTLGSRYPVIACERIYPPAHSPPLTRFQEFMRRKLYPRAKALVAQTQEVADWLHRRFPKTQIHIVANPIELPLPQSLPWIEPSTFAGTRQKLILTVGRLDPQKRMHLLVEAFHRISAEATDWILAILGTGPERTCLEHKIAKLGLSERVLMPGFVGNPGDWYNRAELFVLPSQSEGFPNALAEAMAHGTASIAFDIKTGPAEISQHGQRALLLPDHSPVDSLSAAMLNLISDPTARSELGHKALSVTDDFNLEKILRDWDQVICSVIGAERWHDV